MEKDSFGGTLVKSINGTSTDGWKIGPFPEKSAVSFKSKLSTYHG